MTIRRGNVGESALALLFVVVLLFIGWIVFTIVGSMWYMGEGVSTDYVMGVQRSGLFWKTYDVYLRNEHPSTENTGRYCLPPELSFTLESEELVKLKKAAESNSVCKLYYKSYLSAWPWRCNDGGAIIYKVECA